MYDNTIEDNFKLI